MAQGLILKALSGFYYVESQGAIYECRARGSLRKNGVTPLVGDRAEITALDSGHGVVDRICQRRSCLSRPPVANIDKLFIISSFSTPSPNLGMVDRLSAVAVYHNIQPVIVFNKCDLGNFSEVVRIYRHAGLKTFVVSAETGEGTDGLREELSDCIAAFTGNSGVGKSSLLNRLFGVSIATGDVSEKLGRGRHTTRHTELIPTHMGGYVADTPGFSSLTAENASYDFKARLADCFPDFAPYSEQCRFPACSHIYEADCAVLRALADGRIEKSRHASYCGMMEELKDLKSWETSKKRNAR